MGLGSLEGSLCSIVVRLGGPALAREGPLALHVVAGFTESRLRRGKLGLGLVQGVALRHWVELGDEVIGPYHLPNFHMALDCARRCGTRGFAPFGRGYGP